MAPASKAGEQVDAETGEMTTDPFAVDGDGNPMPEGSFTPLDDVKIDDVFSSLLNLVNRDIVGWRPKAGDRIFGVVADISEGTSEFGTYPLIVIDTPQTEALVGVHCFHQTLKREVESNLNRGTLTIGTNIAIAYKGEGEAEKGKSAPHLYRLALMPAVVSA